MKDYIKKAAMMITLLLAVTLNAAAGNEKPISVSQMPHNAQQLLSRHFSNKKVALAKVESGFFPKEYTVIFTRLQLIKTLIEQLTLVLNTSISAQGNIKRISLIVTFLNILPLPLIYIAFHLGAPPYAMYLISIAIWSICEGGIRIYFAWKNCQIPPRSYFITTLIPCLIITTISLLTGGIITNIMPFGVLRLIITVSCCTGVLIGSFLYKGINVEEREKLTLLVKSLKNKIKHNI